jgi:hypothetical protein
VPDPSAQRKLIPDTDFNAVCRLGGTIGNPPLLLPQCHTLTQIPQVYRHHRLDATQGGDAYSTQFQLLKRKYRFFGILAYVLLLFFSSFLQLSTICWIQERIR